MNEAFSQDRDAWNHIYLFGGNGDGTLFYPGRPRQIGGTTDIPIESMRLKLIREGLEDYEFLVLLAKLGLADVANEAVSRMATTVYQWKRDPDLLYAVRRELGERLSGKFESNQRQAEQGRTGEHAPGLGASRLFPVSP